MTEGNDQSIGPREVRPRPEGQEEVDLRRQARNEAFMGVVRQLLGPETEIIGDNPARGDRLLDAISKHSLNGVTELASDMVKERLKSSPESFEVANPSEVIAWVSEVRTLPPIQIKSIGSIDKDMVSDLGLTKENYKDELRAILSFIDPERTEISTLEFPTAQRAMFEQEKASFKKLITQLVIQTHGIQMRFDRDDPKAWADLYALVEELSSEVMRPYSYHLQEKHAKQVHTPVRTVYEDMAEILESRERAINIAMAGKESHPAERARMLEPLSPRIRALVEEFFKGLDEQRSAGEIPESLDDDPPPRPED